MPFATSSLIFATLVLIAALAVVAKWLRQPYPIVFVVGGGLLALIPGLPRVALQPDLVFLLFLPPLLFAGGFRTEWRDFKRYFTPIMSLAVGLVVFTTAIVAFVAHWFIGIPLAAAFVLGAVVSPPDAVATEAISDDLNLPRAMKAILSGESLVNDATALVVYGFAVAAVASGTFSLWQAGLRFVYVSIAGIAIGWLGSWVVAKILMLLRRKKLADETVSVLFSLITPFVVYLAAQSVDASGVLAAVTAGVLTAQHAAKIFDHDARIASYGVWSVLTFSLNGVLFMLIGLQLRSILGGLGNYAPLLLLQYGAAISATVIVVRFAWVYPATFLRRKFSSRVASADEALPTSRALFVISWAGMRGIVTLATALAIPVSVVGGAPFPDRDLLLFLAFCVIVTTLVGQGLTLPWLIRAMHLPSGDESARSLANARARTAQAGLDALQSIESTFVSSTHWEIAGRIRLIYEQVIAFETVAIGRSDSPEPAELVREMRLAAFKAEREELAGMRSRGDIRDDVFRQMQWDLDLIESRFSSD